MTIDILKQMIDERRLPIVHSAAGVEACITCCSLESQFLAQCTHYIILTAYNDFGFVCRIITQSSDYGNRRFDDNDYVLEKSIFGSKKLLYYSATPFTMEYACVDTTTYKGYVKKQKIIW